MIELEEQGRVRITTSYGYSRLLAESELLKAAELLDTYKKNKNILEFCDGLAEAIDDFLEEVDFQCVTLTAKFRAGDGDGSGEEWPNAVELSATGFTYCGPIEVSAEDWGSAPTQKTIRLLLGELLKAKQCKIHGKALP